MNFEKKLIEISLKMENQFKNTSAVNCIETKTIKKHNIPEAKNHKINSINLN